MIEGILEFNNQDGEECSICLNILKGTDISIMDCNHYFHTNCITNWLNSKKEEVCPICREGKKILVSYKEESKKKKCCFGHCCKIFTKKL